MSPHYRTDRHATTMTSMARVIWITLGVVAMTACLSSQRKPDLVSIDQHAAQSIGDARNPVIVIPGILGTKLGQVDPDTAALARRNPAAYQLGDGDIVELAWGAFTRNAADATQPDGARLLALPMARDGRLDTATDTVMPIEALDRLRVDVGLVRGLQLDAYVDILATLAAGQYRDEALAETGAINYGGQHFTCFQLPYDWRRDISEQAYRLHQLVTLAQESAARNRTTDEPVRVDIVAHSMGGLVLRYYLRYGPSPLPQDGSVPPVTWAGARNVRMAILVGTPNAGSALSVKRLVEGLNFPLFLPDYPAPVIGTMPAVYQLLPRIRHRRVVEAQSGATVDLLAPETWERYGWGLLAPDADTMLAWLLPDVSDPAERREIARTHLTACLARARQLHLALDRPAAPPPGLELHLVVGDSIPTPDLIAVDPASGELTIVDEAPGDGTVTRTSALMDERVGSSWTPRLQSPIGWHNVVFLSSKHIQLTRDPTFTDQLLFLLLEKPTSEWMESVR